MDDIRPVKWDEGEWLNRPPNVKADGDHLVVSTADGSDFWRRTGYGFTRDDGHALLTALPVGTAVEVSFEGDFSTLYDQAGVMVRVDAATWVKAGLETTGGKTHVGAVVTHELSDWSQAPVPEWAGREVTIRVSRAGDALTFSARCEREPWRMIRLAPLAEDAVASAGPFCCSPSRAGLVVRFTRFATGMAA